MNHERLVSMFSQSVGVEKAAAVVDDGLETIALPAKSAYSPREIEDLCGAIAERYDGYIGLVAHEIRVHQQAQQRFDALLERISDPVVVVEFEDDEPTVTWMNPAFQGTFGYDSAAIGTNLADLIVPESETGNPIDDWLAGADDVELRRKTADDDIRTFIFRPVLVTREGGRTEGYGIYVDITDRKRRERMLANQNEQLERFASVVSHDLRNPLNVANGHLNLALDRVVSPDVREDLEVVADAHDRMGELIETLLTLAREGQTVDDPDPVSIASVAARAWTHVDTADATIDVDSLEGAVVAADADRFEQLLENLVRNAVEHGSTSPHSQAREDAVEHGSTSRAEPDDSADAVEHDSKRSESTLSVTIGLLRAGDELVGFFVEDDGPGIAAADRDSVFDYGYSSRSEGTGFGLAIVETIAEAHGWAVSLAPADENRGARFEFTGVEFLD